MGLRQIAIDVVGGGGVVALLYGVAQMSAPAAWVLGGLLAIGFAFLATGRGGGDV